MTKDEDDLFSPMMFTAQLSDIPADFLKWIVVLLISLIAATGSWAAFFFARKSTTRIEPQPIEVKKLDAFITRDFHSSMHGDVVRRLDGHDEDIRAIYSEIKGRADKIDEVSRQRTAALYDKIDQVESRLTDKIDSMPDRVIETLSTLNLLRRPNGKDT